MAIDLTAFVKTYNNAAAEITALRIALGEKVDPEPTIVSTQGHGYSDNIAILSNGKQFSVNSFTSFAGGWITIMLPTLNLLKKRLADMNVKPPMDVDTFFDTYVPKHNDVLNLRPEDVAYLNHNPSNYNEWWEEDAVAAATGLTKNWRWDYTQYLGAKIQYEGEKARGNNPDPITLPKPDPRPGSGYCSPWPFDGTTPLRGEQGNMIYKPLGV